MKFNLSKPVLIDGEEKKELEYDFEELKGDVIENSIKNLQKSGYIPTVQELDPILHANIFAEACGIDYLDVKRFSAKDYMKAVSLVRDFFLSDSEESSQENSSEQ